MPVAVSTFCFTNTYIHMLFVYDRQYYYMMHDSYVHSSMGVEIGVQQGPGLPSLQQGAQ